jgi:hypothetical protein
MNKKQNTMKTTIYIITTLLTLSFNSLYASGTDLSARYIATTELTPSLPVEATFEESVPDQESLYAAMLKVLVPVTPAEADFMEEGNAYSNVLNQLLPVTPEEAEFNDSI